MELSLSLGETTSKTSNGVTAKPCQVLNETATAAGGCSLGFCMTLPMNPLNGTNNQYQEKIGYDGTHEDDDFNTLEDHLITFRENQRIKSVIDGRKSVRQLSPPVQLDLLPLTPVLHHGPLLWSSDNGSSYGGSSRNDPNSRMLAPTGIEEATSSFQQDSSSYVKTVGKMKFDVRNDDDENVINRKKLRLAKEQSAYLEESFKDHSTLDPIQKLELAKKLNLSPRQVEVWFQNRRARTKLKQTEVDCEQLKKCCEILKGENRRLHKEFQELRALKTTSNPFCLQLPATTRVTMCPSCVQVAATTFTTTSTFRSAPRPPSTPNTNLRESINIDRKQYVFSTIFKT